MPLPEVPLPRGTVTIAGTEVPIRALSRSEVIRMRTYEGAEDDAEPMVVSWGAEISLEEARAWLDNVPTEAGGALVEAIFALTGLLGPQVGSTGAGPDAPPSNEP